jgi:LacI family transcriptional regulator
MATAHLLEQGCKHIAHIAGPQHIHIFKERLKGYLDAIKQAGIPYDENLVIHGSVSIESGRSCMQKLLSSSRSIDGVYAVEDFTALGAMQYLKEAGKNIPDDVCLIGFANEAFGRYITPSLSTVNQQTIKMGEEAAKLFFKLIENKDFYKNKAVKLVLEPELIIRQSSKRS